MKNNELFPQINPEGIEKQDKKPEQVEKTEITNEDDTVRIYTIKENMIKKEEGIKDTEIKINDIREQLGLPPSNGIPLSVQTEQELINKFNKENKEPKPEKLYRGFVVDPNILSVDMFKNDINITETSGGDGNERGIYMTDNLRMVESTNYSARSFGAIKVPLYDSGRGRREIIDLPGCGIILQITTQDLPVREPKIHSTWQGLYNNGFIGKEWIADSIPPEKYRVKKLTLSEGATDPNKFSIELTEGSEEELKNAIELIKKKFQEKKDEAIKFSNFLSTISEQSRMFSFSWKPKWEEYKKNNKIE